MVNPSEQQRIQANVEVVREYLTRRFPNCAIDESANLSLWYTFIVTDMKLRKNYKLQVSGPRLSDKSNTPRKTEAELDNFNVAGRMIAAQGDFFYWR